MSRHRVPSKVYFVPTMSCPLFKLCVGPLLCVRTRAFENWEKRAANNFLNCRTDRIDNQRLTSASSQTCFDKHLVIFSFGCYCWGYSLGLWDLDSYICVYVYICTVYIYMCVCNIHHQKWWIDPAKSIHLSIQIAAFSKQKIWCWSPKCWGHQPNWGGKNDKDGCRRKQGRSVGFRK
jgi:hypothetical protein